MRGRCCGPFGLGALLAMFFLGLVLALLVPWAAFALLGLVLLLAALMLIQSLRR